MHTKFQSETRKRRYTLLKFILQEVEGRMQPVFILCSYIILFRESIHPAILLALQPWVSLGLLDNQSPLLPILRLLCPLSYLHCPQICYIIHPSQTRPSFFVPRISFINSRVLESRQIITASTIVTSKQTQKAKYNLSLVKYTYVKRIFFKLNRQQSHNYSHKM